MTDANLPADGPSADSEEASAWPRPGAASPAGWFLPPGGDAAPSLRPGTEPARSDETVATAIAPWWWALPRQIPVVGPTEPVRVPRSGWQLARQAWQESGINWELPADEPAEVAARASRADAEPALPTRAEARSPADADELFRAWQGSVREAAAPRRWLAAAVPWWNRAWQAARIGVPAAVIVAVGAGALIMLTGGANDVLAGRAGSGSQPRGATDATGTTGPRARVSAAALAPVALRGYPGQHGAVSVDSMWSAAGVTVAVGSADGHPAVWRHTAGAAWTLESGGLRGAGQGSPAAVTGRLAAVTGRLAAVTHGPAGWIAVGSVVAGGATEPTVLTSADGVTWQPVGAITDLAGPGARFAGVVAGHGGYVVVGRRMTGGRTFAALWWSSDLRTWSAGSNGGLDGRLEASTANAVAATADGFVAVGSHGGFPALWTSSDGRNWTLRDLPAPPGARGGALRLVAAGRSRSLVVAGGYAATSSGAVPIVVTTANDGARWRQVVLGTSGTVTALGVTGNGFIAAGLSGTAGAQHAVVWNSRDGLTWSAGTPAGNGAGEITSLDSGAAKATPTTEVTGTEVTATETTGTGAQVIAVPAG